MSLAFLGAGTAMLFAGATPALAQAMQAGDVYELTQSYQTTETSSDGSKGSSSGRTGLVERVVSLRDGGVELEYDLPSEATPEDRAREWLLPALVFKAADGSRQLLNTAQLEARLEGWLKVAKWDRSVCGRWIFTWTAFRIECDPQAILARIAELDPAAQIVTEGATYSDPRAAPDGRIVQTGKAGFSVTVRIDPDKVRHERAETDVVVGEISGKPVSLEAALRERAGEQVTGSITVTWETDATGVARKRVKTTRTEIRREDGVTEKRTGTETVERRRVGSAVRGD
ncbi:hypothetical protein K9B35_14100 [Sphingomonas sp. R647]|uniref:hypothetical protein n=1 Tax=Sphingomonas sp. R647 TaxID=2875233 RepID=UPI001CD43C02|nr:hypothetical protein [Sphingomonas sp. R647]MCA1199106.1 hypothetical protein [Sphingomonas sp. R647]